MIIERDIIIPVSELIHKELRICHSLLIKSKMLNNLKINNPFWLYQGIDDTGKNESP
jgi:hypothetical protein